MARQEVKPRSSGSAINRRHGGFNRNETAQHRCDIGLRAHAQLYVRIGKPEIAVNQQGALSLPAIEAGQGCRQPGFANPAFAGRDRDNGGGGKARLRDRPPRRGEMRHETLRHRNPIEIG